MLAAMLIVFREVLEAGLIISVILAACKGIPVRRYIISGVLAGICGAIILAFFTNHLENMLDGIGLEIFSAAILLLAVVMLSWQVLWMSFKGRLSVKEHYLETERILAQENGHFSLGVIVAITVLREGSEVVLFLYSLSLTSASGTGMGMFIGGIAGVISGMLVSWAVYSGLVLIPLRTVFAASNLVLAGIAAGLASQAAGILASVDMLPALGSQIWDSSFILSDNSWGGSLAHTLLGYTATPSGIQILAWLLVISIIFSLRFYLLRQPTVTNTHK